MTTSETKTNKNEIDTNLYFWLGDELENLDLEEFNKKIAEKTLDRRRFDKLEASEMDRKPSQYHFYGISDEELG